MTKVNLHCQNCSVRCQNPLSTLSSPLLEQMEQQKISRQYHAGQHLFYEDTQVFGIYCIAEGHVKLSKMTPEGKTYISRIAQAGELLGYRALLAEENHAHTAEVLEDATVCFIPQELFLQMLHAEPGLPLAFLKLLGKAVSQAETQSRDLAYYSVFERTAKLLLLMKQKFGLALPDGGNLLNVSLTREELASMLGTTAETAVRTLTYFKQKQLIAYKNKKIIVKDIQGLARFIPEV